MKRITIYIAHLLVLVLTGCDKTVLEFPENEGVDPTLVNANLSLAIDPKIEPYEQTGRSEGEVIDAYDVRWIVEVFRDEIGGELAERRVLGCEPAADGHHTIHTSLALHAARYHVVAWMDYVDNGSVDDKYYTIPSLSSISVPAAGNYIGDEDHKDTYVARQEIDLKAHRDRWNETVDVTVTLQRPMAKDNDCYACDVQYGGTLIIEDGTFVGNISAVYVHEGKAEIKGGTFSIVQTETEGDPYRFLLNCYDSNRQAGKASIVVTGGTFENFNPADNAAEGAGTNFVDEGYKAVKIAETPAPNGTFQVVKNAKVDNADELIGALADPEIANIEVASDIDLAAKSSEELTFEEHKTIDIKEGVTLQLGSANFLTAEKGLTLTGKGTLDNSAAASTAVVAAASDVHEHKSLIHVTGGDLLIDGVTLINDPEYHWHGSSYNTAAIAYWNDANVTIRNARVISGEFTLCGMGRNGANTATVTLIDSFFESTSSNLDNKQHWAYAMRLFGSEVLIENCEVKGIQGAVSIEENAKAEIRSGKFYTVNTSGQQDAFYALYVSSSAEVTITGGEFSAPNVRTGLQIEGTSAVVSGDNDTGRPSGSVILKGGKFSGKAYNHVTNTVYAPAAGYQWQAITDGDNLKWAVVPATR